MRLSRPFSLIDISSSQGRSWVETGYSIVLEQDRLVEQLTKLYTFDDDALVTNFLRENPFLLNLLIDAHEKIQGYFGSDVQVTLEVFTDPEAEDSQQLFALIHTDLSLEEEENRLEKLYDEWWLDTLTATRCKLVITVE
jgi:hypothetical protein